MGFYLNKVLSHLLPVTMRRVEADARGFSDNRGNQNRPPSGTNTSSWTNTSSGDSGNPFDNDFFRQHAPTAAAIWKSGWNQYENMNINTGIGAGVNITTSNSTTSSTTTSSSRTTSSSTTRSSTTTNGPTSSSTTANGPNNNYNVPEVNIINISNSPIGKFISGKNITVNEKKEVYRGGSSKFTMDAKNSEFKDSKVGPGDFNITRGSGETQRETPEELVCRFLKMTKVTKDQLVKLLTKGYKFEDMVKKFPATDPEKSEKILKELLS